ncbi:DNA-binding transcriptional regulator, Lrp family [Quadrisphaera granulorum]|uniref:DNA-binding Lrp family transcriptional regulator n=1 Tax=Quadrisphaera granulorum TaxID=317664 RepID=A0A316ARG5_9ACTN|nr:Lrp/AsnC family transcriptional regulator [Quadrisphaera granulorum]PWJ52677.1 DNA-binding Lrp family transcriptional regulator [Quadrisphaera granulorum]SZE97499.1 DNA-binding transcriptional regulator, Lrp family [Quadrisphaera granulorum]
MPSNRRPKAALTDVDRTIVEALRRDARTPGAELARKAGVAPSTASVRLRELERRGVITGYHATIDLDAVGASLQAMVSVRLRGGARGRLREFTEHARALPGVLSVFFLGGEEDFLLHVATADAAALRDLVADGLSTRPEVSSTRTSIIFEHSRGTGSAVPRE